MRSEYDFSKGERGKFYNPDAELNIPGHSDEEEVEESPESDEWPEGYFEETAGAFRDDPISRGDQGELQIRDKIE